MHQRIFTTDINSFEPRWRCALLVSYSFLRNTLTYTFRASKHSVSSSTVTTKTAIRVTATRSALCIILVSAGTQFWIYCTFVNICIKIIFQNMLDLCRIYIEYLMVSALYGIYAWVVDVLEKRRVSPANQWDLQKQFVRIYRTKHLNIVWLCLSYMYTYWDIHRSVSLFDISKALKWKKIVTLHIVKCHEWKRIALQKPLLVKIITRVRIWGNTGITSSHGKWMNLSKMMGLN